MSFPPVPSRLQQRVVTDPQVAATYAVDTSVAALGESPVTDVLVVRARDRADVVEALEYAQAHGIAVVPQGARTGTVGGSRAIEGSLVLNVEGLTDVDIDPENRLATVGPGVVNGDLKRAAAEVGLAYPPDPASSATCTIGGNIATNAGGLCCVRYGVTADYVRGVELVLPGGEVMRTGRRTAKGVAGMDLTGLVVGSEGTLGVVTEATVRLVPAPDPALTTLATFATLDDATSAVAALRGERHGPSLIELLDAATIAALEAYGAFGLPADAGALLLVQSDRVGGAHEDVVRYGAVLAAAGAVDVAVSDDPQESDALMAARRAMNPALEARGPRLVEDVCVPVTRLVDLARAAREACARHGVAVTLSGHAGDGNLHPNLFFDPTLDDAEPGSRGAAHRAFSDLVDLTLALGGTITGEHGVGRLKARYLERELGAREMHRQRALRRFFDPDGLMNPGAVHP